MSIWDLPESMEVGGTVYPIHADFRDVLNIIRHLEDPDNPNYLRWRIAVALFYEGHIPDQYAAEAMEKLADFIACERSSDKPGPKLIDWEQDAQAIVSGVNKVAGVDVRSLPFLHWWSFLSSFYEVGEGQLATIVSIRSKKKRGKKLEKWEQEYYRDNKEKIDMKRKYTAEERAVMDNMKKWI